MDEYIAATVEQSVCELMRHGVPMDRIKRVRAHVWEDRHIVYDDPRSPDEPHLSAEHMRICKLIAVGFLVLGFGGRLSLSREAALVEFVELERWYNSPESVAWRERQRASSYGGWRGGITRRRDGRLDARDAEILDLYDQGVSRKDLAARYGLSRRRISKIIQERQDQK